MEQKLITKIMLPITCATNESVCVCVCVCVWCGFFLHVRIMGSCATNRSQLAILFCFVAISSYGPVPLFESTAAQ